MIGMDRVYLDMCSLERAFQLPDRDGLYDTGLENYVEARRELFRDLTLEAAIARAGLKSTGGTP